MHTAGSSELLAELARPSSAYRRRAWLAMAGLAAFVALYFALAGWFLLTAYRLTIGLEGAKHPFVGYIVGVCAAFLALFMLKAIFFVRRGGQSNDIEIKPAEEPRLFEFLHQLADQAGAPRPYRVFVSARVNAAVFYDLSLLNLLFPSRKNLEIGLALVNSLTLGELRAVLAHEFGHFTQGAMAVGRWVYVAQQIAAHLVARRDKLDAFLVALSYIDIRIAWVGWVLRLIVWSIRSLVESIFSVVVLMQRALSREMEMQADLVAVSLTGSDALIHALHRLQAADDAWMRTLSFVSGESANKRVPKDAFAIHSRVMERMGALLNDPFYGRVPPVPAEAPQAHRVFKAELAQPPQMWLTHPLNHEREANAKRRYIGAPIDERSAWHLFRDPPALREKLTAALVGDAQAAPIAVQDSLQALDRQFHREHLDGRYRGAYFGRSVVRCAASVDALYEAAESPPHAIEALYPPALAADIERLRTLENDLQQLQALESRRLNPSGGVMRYRGKELNAARLPAAIAEAQQEIAAVNERLRAHDRLCRSAHLRLAHSAGSGWPQYLRGLLAVLHYADHTEANLRDAQGLLANTYAFVTATRKVNDAGVVRMINAANTVHAALAQIYEQRAEVRLDGALLERLKAASWAEALGEFKLPPATRENIGEWLKYADSWIDQFAGTVGALRLHALEMLLISEAKVATLARQGAPAEAAPEAPRVPGSFELLQPGQERKRQTRLDWWARFQTAEGFAAGTARLLVAGGIVAAVLGLGGSVGNATITMYNGLARPVTVELDGEKFQLAAFGSGRRELPTDRNYRIETRTREGQLIESFDAEVRGSFASYVYNVAGAAALVEWTAVYGNVKGRADRNLGAPRWILHNAETMFAEPPRSVRTKAAGATREVLSGLGNESPQQQLALLGAEAEQKRLVSTRARWDQSSSPHLEEWLARAMELPDYPTLLAARLKESPNDLVLLRIEQESAKGSERENVCARHRARAEAEPQNRDFRYLATRCLPEPAQSQAFIAGHKAWPDHGWFAFAAGHSHVQAARWSEALEALDTARRSVPSLAELLAVDVLRIHRLRMDKAQLAQYKAGPYVELAKSSEAVRQLVVLESGEGAGPNLVAYSELARGNLARALKLAEGNPQGRARLLRLAAASDGAGPELVSAGLALKPDSGLDFSTAWVSLALATRMHGDTAPYLAYLRQVADGQAEPVVRFIAALQDGATPGGAERLLEGSSLQLRGHGYSAAVIVLGNRAPPAWRDSATRLLFASERPYFKY
jgi:Zn-dependent protease with chaperone function